MINTLLVPELRELLEKNDYETLRDFCLSVDSPSIAEFIGALSPYELFEILTIIEQPRRDVIIKLLDYDVLIKLVKFLNTKPKVGFPDYSWEEDYGRFSEGSSEMKQRGLLPIFDPNNHENSFEDSKTLH